MTDPPAKAIGTYSQLALVKGPPVVAVLAGFDCPGTTISVLSGNFLRATVTSDDGFKLTSTNVADTATGSYTIAAASDGTNVFTPGTPFVYMNGGLVNLLGLLGGSARNVQVYVKPSSTSALAPGTYKGSFKIAWEWRFCDFLAIGGGCTGNLDASPTPIPIAKVAVTMVIVAKPFGVVITTKTTYDPVSNTTNPRAIPASKQRTTITVTNTDTVVLDANSVKIVLPTPNRGVVALDGDGTAATAFVKTTEGSPASSLAVTYTAPANTADDVDFSSDHGSSWTYDPTTTPGAVTDVRIRPHGSMAAGSSFSVSVPYSLF